MGDCQRGTIYYTKKLVENSPNSQGNKQRTEEAGQKQPHPHHELDMLELLGYGGSPDN
ncbi:kd [Sesbania bispinosa]|nr:kd [Sesbania bispinosa]